MTVLGKLLEVIKHYCTYALHKNCTEISPDMRNEPNMPHIVEQEGLKKKKQQLLFVESNTLTPYYKPKNGCRILKYISYF